MGVNEIIQIGNTIRGLRTQTGYTQKQMSELTGIPYSTYSNYENNNREPNKEQLQKIADVLNVSISELLGLKRNESYERYRTIRNRLGYTDSVVATNTGISQSTFSDWKAGRYIPKKEKMDKIAKFLGVSTEYITDGEEKQGYYLNEETAKLAQEMFEDEDMRSLFDMKRDMPPERFKAHIEFMKNLYEQEKGRVEDQ